ncbi:hypothetical protein BD626DRAFT_113343 [Schizophyllum amplum]|uniref:C3H1-type domain-containing protein n=1 Tax=Schizophyllum amplum TaxID=97359 RepID=A0A550CTY1_9AGAR|nr:hypothetical protein BD626DRAFT_113343 [Auriculariopsis ampla]
MAENVPRPSSPFERFDKLVASLRDEFDKSNKAVNTRDGEIEKLRSEFDLYKNAYTAVDAQLAIYRRAKEEAEAQRDNALRSANEVRREMEEAKRAGDLSTQPKGHRVLVLLDGDGAIFNNDLITRGQEGGHAAAQRLLESITSHLEDTLGSADYQVWVHIFFNKRGLTDTFGRAGLLQVKAKFDDFVLGFNQSAERFMMLDVGSTKEAADAKIRVLLEDEIRMPHTVRIYFAGCHDNGYVNTLRSLITAGHKAKLVLLRGYSDMAAGITELNLPDYTVPELFRTSKIVIPSRKSLSQPPTEDLPAAAVTVATPDREPSAAAVASGASTTTPAAPRAPSPETATNRPVAAVKANTSYSSVATLLQQRRGSFVRTTSPEREDQRSDRSSSPSWSTAIQKKKLDRRVPLSKNTPPPCTLFYLAECKFGDNCKYGHHYEVTAEDIEEIRQNAKKGPCPSVNKDVECTWGDSCCYGHVCPGGPRCSFYKQGTCKFIGADMHKAPR